MLAAATAPGFVCCYGRVDNCTRRQNKTEGRRGCEGVYVGGKQETMALTLTVDIRISMTNFPGPSLASETNHEHPHHPRRDIPSPAEESGLPVCWCVVDAVSNANKPIRADQRAGDPLPTRLRMSQTARAIAQRGVKPCYRGANRYSVVVHWGLSFLDDMAESGRRWTPKARIKPNPRPCS